MASFMTFTFTVHSSKNSLFSATDNDLLLAMPIKTSTILASRLLKIMIWNLVTSIFIVGPALFVYATRVDVPLSFYPISILVFILLPIIPSVLASLIGYFIAFLTSKSNFKNWIEIILSLAFIFGFYYLIGNGENLLNLFINNQEDIINIIKWLFYPIYLVYEIFAFNNYLSLFIYILLNTG
jgi:ABC-2 type transport system permease protein